MDTCSLLTHYLFLHNLLGTLGVTRKLVQFFISHILLSHLKLTLYLVLYCIFVLSLYALGLSQNFLKFASQCAVNRLFNFSLWFKFMQLFGTFDVSLHFVKLLLAITLILLKLTHKCADVLLYLVLLAGRFFIGYEL